MIVACYHPLPLSACMLNFDLVSILFGTSIPTSFNILVKMFLHLFHWFLLCVATHINLLTFVQKLPNADVLCLFRQTTCSVSASVHYNTLKVRKIYNYTESWKFVKTRIVHHLLLLLLLLLSNSVQTAYRETGVSNRSNSFTAVGVR